MRKILKKLLLGKVSIKDRPKSNPIRKCLKNVKSIWENDHHEDNGIEKIFRLTLSSSQLLFPGIYIKYLANLRGFEYRDLITDLYVLLKVLFPLFILKFGWQEHLFLVSLMVYLLLETVIYIPMLIFASDLSSKPRSYKRSMLLIFFNYIEIVFSFGVLYSLGNYLNKSFTHWFDAIYFSIVTSTSIGYGDYFPVTTHGKVLVSFQSLLFLFFVVLFLNFFSNKVKTKGYFEDQDEK